RLGVAAWVRSPATATAAPPAAVIAAVVLSSPAASRSPSATRAPSRASSSAISRPRPLAAPVTTATRSRTPGIALPPVLCLARIIAREEAGGALIEHELASPSVAAICGLADDLLMSDGARAGQAGR